MPNGPATILALALLTGSALSQLPSPTDFLGHEVGADYQLCNYTDMVRYFRKLEAGSDRMRLVDIGPTSYGQRTLMAVISSPANLARVERLRDISCQLSKGRLDGAAARAFADEGRAVVWIDAGLHATESIAGQNIIELVWQMVSRDDAEVKRILDEVVLLACPVNPDGYELIANAYRATRNMAIPVLYQRYVGHDNNRDFYACNQVETQNTTRVFYKTWCPQIVYNHHQSAPRGTIMYTPPFRDPMNYHVDPMVARGIELVSAHMNARFAYEGKPGIISESGASYSTWWNGGLRTVNYFHNVIGILTESFGRPAPTKITQTMRRRLPYGDYPDPVPTQMWHARQTIEYMQTANFAILDYAARYRRELLHGIWTMASRSIERGSRDHWTVTPKLMAAAEEREESETAFSDPALRDPRVYVLPRNQRDWAAARRFARALDRCGVEVHRARAAFELSGKAMPAGSLVVLTAQAYRPHVMDMFEPQWHPDDTQNGKPVPPYDAAGWTLAMQMGVEVERGFDGLDDATMQKLERLGAVGLTERNLLPAATGQYWLDARDSHSTLAANRLLAAGRPVAQGDGGFVVDLDADSVAVLAEVASVADMRIREGKRGDASPPTPLRRARVGLFDRFGGHMPTGWDQWVLEDYGFAVQRVFGERIHAGELARGLRRADVPHRPARPARPAAFDAAPQSAGSREAERCAAAVRGLERPRGAIDRAHERSRAARDPCVRRGRRHAARVRRRMHEGDQALRSADQGRRARAGERRGRVRDGRRRGAAREPRGVLLPRLAARDRGRSVARSLRPAARRSSLRWCGGVRRSSRSRIRTRRSPRSRRIARRTRCCPVGRSAPNGSPARRPSSRRRSARAGSCSTART